MDVQDQSKHTIPSVHESHGVYLCNRCGWPFPNPHPSARHRRAHKKICGTIDGYTNLIDSGVVSDDEHHLDDDKDKTPSPKIEKKTSIGSGGRIGGSFSRSEDEFFSDAVTEFSDTPSTGSVKKSLDRDLFFSFTDAESGGTNEVLNAPIEINKVDDSLALSEKIEEIGETETDGKSSHGLVKDGIAEPTPEVSATTVNVEPKILDKFSGVGVGEKLEDGISEVIKNEKLESECVTENVSEVVKPAEIAHGAEGISEEIKHEKFELDHEHAPEVTQESEIDQKVEQAVKEPETVHGVSVLTEKEDLGAPESEKCSKEQISEDVKELDTGLTEKEDLGAPESEKCSDEQILEDVKEPVKVLKENEDLAAPKMEKDSKEQTEEIVKEPVTVLTENEDLDAPKLEKCSEDLTQEVVKEPVTALTEKEYLGALKSENGSTEQIQEVVKEPELVLTEKEDLGAPKLEKDSNEETKEVVEEPVTVLTEKDDLGAPKLEVKEPESVLTEKEDLDAPKLEKCSDEHTHEVVEEPTSVLTEKDDLGASNLEKDSNEQIQEVLKEPVTALTEKDDLVAPNLEKDSNKHIQEVLEEPITVLTEKDNLGAPNLEKDSNEQIQQALKEPVIVLTEKDDLGAPELEKCSNEHTQEVFEEPNTLFTEKDDLVAPNLEKPSKEEVVQEHTQEVSEEPNTVLTEKDDLGAPTLEKHSKEHTLEVVKEPNSTLIEKEDLGAPNSEKSSHKHNQEDSEEPKVNDDSKIVADADTNASERFIGKPMINQDSGVNLSVDSSSRNSLEGNWGSVSVLSTASIDAETLHSVDKPKLNSKKPDEFEPPSFMTLVEPEGKDQKTGSSEVQDTQKAGWFPTITNVSNESEGRKKNEDVIAKVTNWSSGKQSASLKNLLGEAKSPSVKESVIVVNKDEGAPEKASEELMSSPPKLIEDGKKGDKKVKGKSSWMPFACCSSVNVVN